MDDPLLKYGMNAGAKPEIYINARILRKRMTEPERKLWEHILVKSFNSRFRRQHPFGRYILDFYCHAKRLSIEIDGPNHLDPHTLKNDFERTSFINSMGVKEIRFTNDQVLNSFGAVCESIQKELDDRILVNTIV